MTSLEKSDALADSSAPESPNKVAQAANWVALGGVALSVVMAFFVSPPTLWGLLPIVLYAALCLMGMEVVLATGVAVVSGLLLLHPTPAAGAEILGQSLGDNLMVIGMIIILGAAAGEVLKVTGVAETIVRGIMRMVGSRSNKMLAIGIMLACLVLVACLGTLAGALAIAASVIIPTAARAGFTKSATASMMFIGGCAGLALAPFAGSNVIIMQVAKVSYPQYLLYGAGPLAILSMVLGIFVVMWRQRRTIGNADDLYQVDDGSSEEKPHHEHAGVATVAFLITLVASVVYAVVANAGTTFPLMALPVLGVVAGIAGRLPILQIVQAMYRGASSLISMLLLFWLLAALFILMDKLAPFQVILDAIGGILASGSVLGFCVIVALLGWVGVPGGTAAQVALLGKVFGPIGTALGVPASAWVIVLLFASKADTYGPFPNGNMVGVMGIAESKGLRNMLITGWLLLVPAIIMYAIILMIETL